VWAALGLYGASNGVMAIIRAVMPAELFGRERYATLNRTLPAPVVASRAAGPVAASFLWAATGGYTALLWGLALVWRWRVSHSGWQCAADPLDRT
jgi:hypothetical protein